MTQATTADAVGYLPVVSRGNEKLVFLEFGGNDALEGVPTDKIEAHLSELIRMLRARGSRVILAGLKAPPDAPKDYAQAYQALFMRVAAKEGAELLPGFLDGVYGHPELGIGDGMHANAEGQKKFAENVETFLKARNLPTPDCD